jgi:hypothetical protein
VLRIILAAVLTVHGLVHLIGFVVTWRITEVAGFSAETLATWGRVSLGDAGAKWIGIGWLLSALGLTLSAIYIGQGAPVGLLLMCLSAALSSVLCIGAAPVANAGFVMDVILLCTAVVLQTGAGRAAAIP